MPRRNYSADLSDDGRLILEARDIDAKQILFGWGGEDKIHAQYYGRGLNDAAGDRETWRWMLTPDAANQMVTYIDKYKSDPNYYNRVEARRAQELKAILEDYLEEENENRPSAGERSIKWNVYQGGKLIDSVFYSADVTADDVRRSLINHDGYPSDITVRRGR